MVDSPYRMARGMTRILVLAIAILCAAAAAQGAEAPGAPGAPGGAPWVSAHARGHPLAGRIWQPLTARFVAPEAVVAEFGQARFVLLGEKHDNPDHHSIQAWLVARMIAAGRRPAVAFEMFTGDQQALLDGHLSARPKDAAGIGAAVSWAESGWPDWELYRPIAQAALDGGAAILAASLPRPLLRKLARQGVSALGDERVVALGLDRPLPKDLAAPLREEIALSHCGQLPESMIGPMVAVMIARDAQMAEVLRRGATLAGHDGAVLITGKGHARNDFGVPFHLRRWLRRNGGSATIVSLALVEVAEDLTEPAAYAEFLGARDMSFDFVWFTPIADPEDPCAKYADQLQRARERHENDSKDPD
jgi:uncharacterized iron-regulated protein